MKKLIIPAIMLTAALCLTACGSKKPKETEAPKPTVPPTEAPVTQAPTSDPGELITHTFGEGAYTLSYPSNLLKVSDLSENRLTEIDGFTAVEFDPLEDENQLKICKENLQTFLGNATQHTQEEISLLGFTGEKYHCVQTDGEYDLILLQFGEEKGKAGVGLQIKIAYTDLSHNLTVLQDMIKSVAFT